MKSFPAFCHAQPALTLRSAPAPRVLGIVAFLAFAAAADVTARPQSSNAAARPSTWFAASYPSIERFLAEQHIPHRLVLYLRQGETLLGPAPGLPQYEEPALFVLLSKAGDPFSVGLNTDPAWSPASRFLAPFGRMVAALGGADGALILDRDSGEVEVVPRSGDGARVRLGGSAAGFGEPDWVSRVFGYGGVIAAIKERRALVVASPKFFTMRRQAVALAQSATSLAIDAKGAKTSAILELERAEGALGIFRVVLDEADGTAPPVGTKVAFGNR